VLGYANGKPGDPHDAGMLDQWMADLGRDLDKLSARVYTALYGDLRNWARVVVGRMRREALRAPGWLAEDESRRFGDDGTDTDGGAAPPRLAIPAVPTSDRAATFKATDYPLMHAFYVDGYSYEQIARVKGWTRNKVKHELSKERKALAAHVSDQGKKTVTKTLSQEPCPISKIVWRSLRGSSGQGVKKQDQRGHP